MEILSQLLPVLARTLEIYSLILLVRVLLSWFPNLDWSSNPVLSTVSSITASPQVQGLLQRQQFIVLTGTGPHRRRKPTSLDVADLQRPRGAHGDRQTQGKRGAARRHIAN